MANSKILSRIGCWNVRTMYSIGKTAYVTSEIKQYRIIAFWELVSASGLGLAGSELIPERSSSIQVGEMMFTRL